MDYFKITVTFIYSEQGLHGFISMFSFFKVPDKLNIHSNAMRSQQADVLLVNAIGSLKSITKRLIHFTAHRHLLKKGYTMFLLTLQKNLLTCINCLNILCHV